MSDDVTYPEASASWGEVRSMVVYDAKMVVCDLEMCECPECGAESMAYRRLANHRYPHLVCEQCGCVCLRGDDAPSVEPSGTVALFHTPTYTRAM